MVRHLQNNAGEISYRFSVRFNSGNGVCEWFLLHEKATEKKELERDNIYQKGIKKRQVEYMIGWWLYECLFGDEEQEEDENLMEEWRGIITIR